MVSNFLKNTIQSTKTDWNRQANDAALHATWSQSTQALHTASQNRNRLNRFQSADVRSTLFQAVNITPQTHSLGELIALSCHHLVSYIQLSRFLPIYVKQAWIRQIRMIDLERWQAGLTLLEELYFDHHCAQTDYRPDHDIFDDNASQNQDFNAEMACIEHELNTIEMILKYAEAMAEVL